MGVGEGDSTRDQPVDVWSSSLGMPPEMSGPIVEVVNRDKQDIWPIRRVNTQ